MGARFELGVMGRGEWCVVTSEQQGGKGWSHELIA